MVIFILLLMAEILHQLRSVVYPIIYRVSAPSQVVVGGFNDFPLSFPCEKNPIHQARASDARDGSCGGRRSVTTLDQSCPWLGRHFVATHHSSQAGESFNFLGGNSPDVFFFFEKFKLLFHGSKWQSNNRKLVN